MQTSDFDYFLPKNLIAQFPVSPRDSSRLLVVDRKNETVEHRHFYDIIDYLHQGDLLVWNNSKVFKARLLGRLEAGEEDENKDNIPDKPLLHQQMVEIFLLRPAENVGVWKALAKPGRRVKPGMNVRFADDFYCSILLKESDGTILVQFPDEAETVRQKANRYGHIPVPPYVENEPDKLEIYQTVYAKHEGSVAAPTAGFHFTPELIEKLKNKCVEFAEVTLHVGLGTFQPVKAKNIEEHKIHSEYVELTEKNVEKINRAKKEGRRVIAVGTTTVRTLEGVALFPLPYVGRAGRGLSTTKPPPNLPLIGGGKSLIQPFSGDINLFITPGFKFQVVDALITNFHLPKSTLLMLVSAFIGDVEKTLQIYQQAVEVKYRFYSFGDAMFIY